jgi:hypothetical protein
LNVFFFEILITVATCPTTAIDKSTTIVKLLPLDLGSLYLNLELRFRYKIEQQKMQKKVHNAQPQSMLPWHMHFSSEQIVGYEDRKQKLYCPYI